ncbi:MAG TPA: CorA family divalent cation transporter [Rickettsiales bacterium]|nr:CorA family divalent cation transporter [Rickettsiales bacterium]
MPPKDFIFFSYSFDKEGKAVKLKNNEVAQELKSKELSWAHLDGNNSESKVWLKKNVDYLDHLIIEALFAEETRPRIIEFDSGILIILRGIDGGSSYGSNGMASIRLWIDQSRIVSIQKRNFSSAFDLAQSIELGHKIRNSGEFLYNLIYEILHSTAQAISSFDEKLDAIEAILSGKNYNKSLRENVITIRKQTTIFKRYMLPQKEVITVLKTKQKKWINDWAIRHFLENQEQITHIIEELDEAKERAQIIHDEVYNAIADKVNKSMFKISLIASIFMPLSFVAGLFGMNVGGIPGENNPMGFYAIVYFLTIAFGVAFVTLKRKKWFRNL